MTPIEIKTELARLGIRAAKIHGQHFLVDRSMLARIVAAADLKKKDSVLEIGPGLGVLTAELSRRAGCVVAVEIDPALSRRLEEKHPRVYVRTGDVRHLSTGELVAVCPSAHYKLVANIPYNITSDVLEKFLLEEPSPNLLVLLVQYEVAERIVASAGAMTRLGVFVQYFGRPEIVARVSRGAFWPSPKVESAILKIQRFPREVLARREREVPRDDFFRIVRAGFAAPRRKLAGNLAGGLHRSREEVHRALEALHIPLDTRAEALGIDQWIALARLLHPERRVSL